MTDDLHRRQPPPTSTSMTSPTHATPVTCTFKMNTTHCVACATSLSESPGPHPVLGQHYAAHLENYDAFEVELVAIKPPERSRDEQVDTSW
ncbi:hypothetical protein ABZT34_39080 [Streptomyces sp. NPDC005329]|uniref:hypothetical protein n=1 Tax=Streptomyces sp. NPDC005329 TaxID=3157034 RepID=UPI0033BD5C04